MQPKDKEATVVIFRTWNPMVSGVVGPDVIALFPFIRVNDAGHIGSYERVGQHSAADYHYVISVTRPAYPPEYRALKAELEARGYKLVIRQKRNP